MKKPKYKKVALTSKGYVDKMANELKARGFDYVLIVDDKTFTSRACSNVAWGLGNMALSARVWEDWYCQSRPSAPLDLSGKKR